MLMGSGMTMEMKVMIFPVKYDKFTGFFDKLTGYFRELFS